MPVLFRFKVTRMRRDKIVTFYTSGEGLALIDRAAEQDLRSRSSFIEKAAVLAARAVTAASRRDDEVVSA